jgi:hypothetical protein
MNEGFLSRWSRLKKGAPDPDATPTGRDDQGVPSNGSALASDPALAGVPSASSATPNDAPAKFLPWSGINPAYQRAPVPEVPGQEMVGQGMIGQGLSVQEASKPLAFPENAPGGPLGAGEVQTMDVGPPPLQDVASLNMSSDYKPFMQANVPAQTRNAALKKLFTDPSFNVMDGLDTYVADYSQPDPIPADMLKELLKSKAFCLFDDIPEDEAKAEEPELIDVALAAPEAASIGPVEAPWPRVAEPPAPEKEKLNGENSG